MEPFGTQWQSLISSHSIFVIRFAWPKCCTFIYGKTNALHHWGNYCTEMCKNWSSMVLPFFLRRRGGLLSQWHWPGVSSSHSLGVFACLSVLDFTMATWHLLASGHYSLTLPFVSLRQSYAVIFLVRVKEDDIIIKTLKTSKSFYIYLSQYYLVLHIWGNTSWEKKRFLWVLPK